jgi:hypothetical protein
MSKRKDRERAETGQLYRSGRYVSKEQAVKMHKADQNIKQILRVTDPLSIIAQYRRLKTHVPDLRCPHCDSSLMGKMGITTCPECNYIGEPVDVSQGGET